MKQGIEIDKSMVKHLLQMRDICLLTVLSFLLLNVQSVRADGSKDMYPSDYYTRYGVTAGSAGDYRACLMSGITSSGSDPDLAAPFPTYGTIKVFVNAGEHIYVASSAMVVKNNTTKESYGRIDWRAPDGSHGSVTNIRKGGLIPDRSRELAGPNINGSTAGYDAYKITVADNQAGVWEIDFVGATQTLNFSTETPSNHTINSWKEDVNRPYINAFDVSVSNIADNAFIQGRAFANVLNLLMPSDYKGSSYSCEWYTTLYVLTNTGYLYEVKPNGQNGHFATFFANNKGVQSDPMGWVTDNTAISASKASASYGGVPSYKSLNSSLTGNRFSNNRVPIYDPRRPDTHLTREIGGEVKTVDDITHKIFFTKPASDLPASAPAVFGSLVDETWLLTDLNSKDSPLLSNVTLVGKESHVKGLLGPEGVDIFFEANASGEYLLEMDFGSGYQRRILSGFCEKGENVIDWDGLDGNGKRVPVVDFSVAGKLKSAEIHFPFFDLENNKHGLILNQLNAEWTAVERDTVYWDDSSLGVSKQTNEDALDMTSGTKSPAHIWYYRNNDSRGNQRIMDTWTYAQGASRNTQHLTAVSRFIDLGITSIVCDASLAHVGDIISYTLEVENKAIGKTKFNGDSVMVDADADSASVGVWFPTGGFVTTSVELVSSDDPSCRVVGQPSGEEYGLGFISLKNGKKATIRVSGYATSALAHSVIQPTGFIMRPGDFFELDAKNLASDGMPLNPLNEYEGIANDNVKRVGTTLFLLNSAPDAASCDTIVPAGRTVTGNVLSNDKDVDGDALSIYGYMVNDGYGTLGTPLQIRKDGRLCGSFTLNANGSYSFTADGAFDGMVPEIYYGVYDGFLGNAYSPATDLIPGLDTGRVMIQVLMNHAPTVNPTEVSINRSGDKTLLPIAVHDEDGDPLSLSLTGTNASYYRVEGDSVYYVGPAMATETIHHFNLVVSDGVRTPSVNPITVTIKVNQAPTLSPDTVEIYAKRYDDKQFLLPVTISDPDGDKVTIVSIACNYPSYFTFNDGNLYFVGNRNTSTRSKMKSTYSLNVTLRDEHGVSSVVPLVVYVNVVSDEILPSGAVAAADDISYGTSLSEALVLGSDVEGSWSVTDSELGTVDLSSILPVGQRTIDLMFMPSASGYLVEEVKNVTFNVLPRPVTIKSAAAEKVYDGTALSAPSVSFVGDSLVGSDRFVFNSFATLINADTILNTFSYSAAAGTSLSNYDVTVVYDTLVVIPRPITLSSPSASKQYDGTPLSSPSVTVSSGSLAGVDALFYSDFASITDAGSVENTFTYVPGPGTSLSNYNVTLDYGALTVSPVVLTDDYVIELAGDAFLYDASAHEPGVTVKVDGSPLSDEYYTVRYENNVTSGNSAMVIVSGKTTGNYVIKTDTAFFSILKRTVIFTSSSCEKVYDGTPLYCNAMASVLGDGLLSGDSYDVTYSDSLTNVGTKQNTFSIELDTTNYQMSKNYGVLTVTPKSVAISDADVVWSDTSFVYDGDAHCPSALISVDGLVLDPATDYSISCSDNVKAGVKTAFAVVSMKAGGNFQFVDYTGRFSITPAPITITDKSVATKTYDGTRTAVVSVNSIAGVVTGEDVQVTATALFDDADAGKDKIVSVSYELTGADKANYSLVTTSEELSTGVISPLTVDLSWSTPNSFSYDGATKSVTASVTNAVGEDVVNVVSYADNSAVDAGDYVAKATLLDNTNYQLPDDATYDWSIVSVSVKVDVTLRNLAYTYDQTAHEPDVIVKLGDSTLTTADYSVSYVNNVDAGDSAMVIVSGKAGGNYTIVSDTSYFSIAKRSIIFKTVSCGKVFDGTPLTCETASIADSSRLLPGDNYTLTFLGSQTNVGSSKNMISVVFEKDNYLVGLQLGDLVVTPKPIEITTNDIVWNDTVFVYDGKEHCPTATITVDGNVLNPMSDYAIFCSNNVNVGSDVAHIAVKSQDGGNFEFTDYEVNFSILPVVVSIADSSVLEKDYDGNSVATVLVNALSFKAPGDSVAVKTTAKYNNASVGVNKKVTISYELYGPQSGNYVLAYDKAEYDKGVINPKEVSLSWSMPNSFEYDGNKHGVSASVVTDLHVATIHVTGYENDSALAVGDYVARALGLDNRNFKLPANDSLPWSIVSSTLDETKFILHDTVLTYDGMTHPADFEVNPALGFVQDVDYSVSYKNVAESSWTSFPPINAGVYDVKVVVLNPNYAGVEMVNWQITVNKAPLTIVPNVTHSKVYDRTTDASASVEDVIGVVGLEEVSVSSSARYDTFTTDASTIIVTYTLLGEDRVNYIIPDSIYRTEGAILPYLLTVDGTTALDKSFDGSLDASAVAGTLSPAIAPDSVSVSVLSAYFSSDTIGNGTDVYVTYQLSGPDAKNYSVKPDTVKANILEPAVTFVWTLADATYGKAIVGVNPMVEIEQPLSGLISYFVDGVPVDSGYVIPVGTHALQARFSADGGMTVPSGGKSINVSLKYLALDSYDINLVKTYDGTDSVLSLSTDSVLIGVVGEDDVRLNAIAAKYNNAQIGADKIVFVSFSLTGDDVANYAIEGEQLPGVIKVRQVNLAAGDSTKEYDGTPLVYDKVSIVGDGFIEGDLLEVHAVGEITEPGYVLNKIVFEFSNDSVMDNYDIVIKRGFLVVTKISQTMPQVTPVHESAWGMNDGRLLDLSVRMEMHDESDTNFVMVTNPDSLFAPGTYYVRFPESQYYALSETQIVTILPGPSDFEVTLLSSDSTRGTVIGAGIYPYGTDVTIEATANIGYHFVAWNDTIFTNPFTFGLVADTSFSASFAPNSYNLYVMDDGVALDTLSVLYGDSVTVSMMPTVPTKAGYDFMGWSPSLPLEMDATDMTVKTQWTKQSYIVRVDTASLMGRVTTDFMNPVDYLDTISMTVTPFEGFHFVSWSDGETSNPREVVVTGDSAFSPLFAANGYDLYVMSDGVVLDTLHLLYGDTVSEDMLNVPLVKDGYIFKGWSPVLPFVMGAYDAAVVAQWEMNGYRIEVDSELVGGTILTDFENPVSYDDTIHLVAVPSLGYHFVSWSDGCLVTPREIIVKSDSSFSALFEANSHNIYVMDGETGLDTIPILFGDTVSKELISIVPDKRGHDFAGWLPSLPFVAGDSDVVVIAQWTKRMYVVDVDSTIVGGSVDKDFVNPVPFGTIITLTASPSEGYHFVFWNDGTIMNPLRMTVYSDTVCSAIFAPNLHQLVVLSDGDTLMTQPVAFGDSVSAGVISAMPEKTGYDFAGWSPALPLVVADADVVVVAQFTKKTFEVTIDTLFEEGNLITDFENPVSYGDTVILTAVPADGFHFESWNDGDSTNPRAVVVVSDTSLSPIFSPNQYRLFLLSDGDTLKNVPVYFGDSIKESICDIIPTKECYDFSGWSPSLPMKVGAADVIVEAQFSQRMFVVNVDTLLDEGTVSVDTPNPVVCGDTVRLTASAASGFHFVSWNDGDTTNPRAVVVVSDTAVAPVFSPNRYQLFVMNDDTIVTLIPVYHGDVITDSMVAVSMEKQCCDFVGWSPSLPIVVDAEDVTIEAQWSKKSIELTFDTLFEEGRIVPDFDNPVTYGDTVVLTVEPAEGYHFISWNDGDTINPRQLVIVSDTSLYPIFMPNTYDFVVVVDADTLLNIVVTYGDTITDSLLNIIPEKIGYDFIGWSPSLPLVVGAGDVTLEAQWTKKIYHIAIDTTVENGNVLNDADLYVAYEDTIILQAVADEGFHFVSWSDGNRSNPREIIVTGDSSFAPSFGPSIYYVTIVSDFDTLIVLPVHYKDSIMRQQLDSLYPSKVGHDFVGWNVDLPLVMPSHDTSITALYDPKIFSVITKINGNVGKVTGDGDYPYGTVVDLEAIPNLGYHFVSWGDGDTLKTLRFVVSSDTIVSALFAKDIDEMMVDTLVIPSFGYCPNTEDVIRYTLLNSESPTEYKIIYSEEAKLAGFVDVDFTRITADNEVKIVIPDCPANVYRARIQFKNAINSVTPFFDVDLRVNLSSDYITDIWKDVVSVVNTENIFTQYQWYHDDVKIGGANSPYYCEKKGLTGNYYLETVTTDGKQLRTCKKWFDYGFNTTLSVYPNPTYDNATAELSVDNGSTHMVTITNTSGVVVFSSTFVGRKTQLDFRRLPSGTYVVSVDGLSVKEIKR